MSYLLEFLRDIFPKNTIWRVLEIKSGDGANAINIATQFPNLEWVMSEVEARQESLRAIVKNAKLKNLSAPIAFDITKNDFPKQSFNAVFATDFLQSVSWKEAKSLIKMLGTRLRKGSQVLFLEAFKYEGEESAAGLRAFVDVSNAMTKAGFVLKRDFKLDAGKRLLHFERLEYVPKS